MGSLDNRDFPTTRLRNAQFVSFLESADVRTRSSDRYDSILRRRRVLRRLVWLGLASSATWIVVESAHALSFF